MSFKRKSYRKAMVLSLVAVILIAAVVYFFLLPKKTNMNAETARVGNITTYFGFSGNIDAKNRQTIYADKVLQVNEIDVIAGQQVNADDILMTTTAGDRIKARISGEISKIYPELNAQILPGAKLADIVDYSIMQLKIQVDEYDLSAIAVDREATVTVNALGKDITGKVTEISKEGVFLNGVTYFNAVISLAADPSLKTGMSAEARILNQSAENVTILPVTAIQFDDSNNPYVYMKNGRKSPQKVAVTLGINDGVNVEIRSGISGADSILVPKSTNAIVFGRNQGQQNTTIRPSITGGGQ